MNSTSFAIIGSGIAGASIAYHLSQETDRTIAVYDRGDIAGETTTKSGATFGWYGDPIQIKMKRYAWELYNRFMSDPLTEPRYNQTGSLTLASSEQAAQTLRKAVNPSDDEIASKLLSGCEVSSIKYLSNDEIKQALFVPLLDTADIIGALYRPNFGYMDPVALTYEFIERAQKNGVAFRTHSPVTDINTSAREVTNIVVDSQNVAVDEVICAAGPWNIEISAEVGINLPVEHTLGPIMRLQAPLSSDCTIPSLSHHESGVFCRRDFDGTFLAGHRPTDQNAGTQFNPDMVGDTVPQDLRDMILRILSQFLPLGSDTEPVDEWVGIRSTISDDRPIVGWTDIDGFSIAAFDSSGIQLAPAVGRIIAQQLLYDDPTKYYDDLSITRFSGHADVYSA